MHEFSVASESANKIIVNALGQGAKKIRRVEILIGELSLVSKDQLLFWMEEILRSHGEIARGVKIDAKPLKAVVKCNQCGYEGGLKLNHEDHLYPEFYCPACNQTDIDIKKGRECILNKIQIEK